MRRIVLVITILLLSVGAIWTSIVAIKVLRQPAKVTDNSVELPLLRAIAFKDGFAYTFLRGHY